MPDLAAQIQAFFSRGIDSVTARREPAQPPVDGLHELHRLSPPDHDGGSALDLLFPASAIEAEVDAAIRPVVVDRELLLPRPFADALQGACMSMQRLNERHGKSMALDRAARILLAEQDLRDLARMYRDALHQA